MESMKTRRKKRHRNFFLKCFKPDYVVMDETLSSSKAKTVDPLLAYISGAEKGGFMLSMSLTVEKDEDEGSGILRREKSIDRSFRKAIMGALNETSLGKKIIKRRRRKKNKGLFKSSKTNLEGESDMISDQEGKITQGNITDTSFSSIYCSSSAFTPSLQSSFTNSTRSWSTQASSFSPDSYPPRPTPLPVNENVVMKEKQDSGEGTRGLTYGSNMTPYFLLTGLLVLILWGKCCAILWTSIGLYIMPKYQRRACNEGSLCVETEFDLVHYKMKNIMERLLQRMRRNKMQRELIYQSHIG